MFTQRRLYIYNSITIWEYWPNFDLCSLLRPRSSNLTSFDFCVFILSQKLPEDQQSCWEEREELSISAKGQLKSDLMELGWNSDSPCVYIYSIYPLNIYIPYINTVYSFFPASSWQLKEISVFDSKSPSLTSCLLLYIYWYTCIKSWFCSSIVKALIICINFHRRSNIFAFVNFVKRMIEFVFQSGQNYKSIFDWKEIIFGTLSAISFDWTYIFTEIWWKYFEVKHFSRFVFCAERGIINNDFLFKLKSKATFGKCPNQYKWQISKPLLS